MSKWKLWVMWTCIIIFIFWASHQLVAFSEQQEKENAHYYDCSGMTVEAEKKAWDYELACITDHSNSYCRYVIEHRWCKRIKGIRP
jgi:hypothetical protein